MNLHKALRELRSEKQWFDQAIASLEQFQRSRQAFTLPDYHLAQNGQGIGDRLSSRDRRRLARLLSGNVGLSARAGLLKPRSPKPA